MNITKKKEEILRLVEQLSPGRSGSAPLSRNIQSRQRHWVNERIQERQQRLREVKSRREQMGLDLLEDRLLSICETLEERIFKIEQMVSDNHKGSNSQEYPDPFAGMDVAKPNSSVRPAQASRSTAPSVNSMLPDIMASEVQPAVSKGQEPVSRKVHSLGGLIQEGIVADVLQLVSSNGKTGVFTLEQGDKRIDLYFDEGSLCHAQTDGMEGQSAFFAAMALEEGQFYFDESDAIPEERTIDGNTQFMILEALRQIDEEKGGS